MFSAIVLTSPLVGYEHMGHNCASEASVTYIPAGSVLQLQIYVLASQLQLIQTYLVVRCNSKGHACCSS